MWAQTYEERLRLWASLRESVSDKPLSEQLNIINNWWSYAPRVNNVVHWHDKENWLSPWELLAEKGYCELASALGLAYTIILVNKNVDVQIALAKDESSSDVTILIVDDEHILNWDINSVISKEQYKFKIKETFDCTKLNEMIG